MSFSSRRHATIIWQGISDRSHLKHYEPACQTEEACIDKDSAAASVVLPNATPAPVLTSQIATRHPVQFDISTTEATNLAPCRLCVPR